MPLRHSPDFGTLTEEELTDLSAHVRRVLRKIYFGLDDPNLNRLFLGGAVAQA